MKGVSVHDSCQVWIQHKDNHPGQRFKVVRWSGACDVAAVWLPYGVSRALHRGDFAGPGGHTMGRAQWRNVRIVEPLSKEGL